MVVLASLSFTSYAQESIIPNGKIPVEIVKYVKKYFPDNSIFKVVKDREILSTTYEVDLQGNIELEFDGDFQITDIKADSKLPDQVIPKKILAYVHTNYPNVGITDWELDGRYQAVELENDLDIVFDLDGRFVKIDD